ncbi:MAG: hypothetical protein SGARI_006394, partial [Bacillariaceae sp.]
MKLSAALLFLAPSFAAAMGNGRDNGKGRDILSYTGTVKITNTAPIGGTCQTDIWVGIHDGSFDLYDRGVAASPELERIAEDGTIGPLSTAFLATEGAVWDGSVGGTPFCPGDEAEVTFDLTIPRGQPLYF